MNLLLKYKDKIVSFGLLPIIITLIGIHFFPTTAMLGTGLAISIAGLLYDVLRLKGLNFFLLQGTIGIGICFLLRLFTGYDYIPKNSLTPSLEFMLLICAFIHVTAPEIYRNFFKKVPPEFYFLLFIGSKNNRDFFQYPLNCFILPLQQADTFFA